MGNQFHVHLRLAASGHALDQISLPSLSTDSQAHPEPNNPTAAALNSFLKFSKLPKSRLQEWERMFKLQTSSDLDMSFSELYLIYYPKLVRFAKEFVTPRYHLAPAGHCATAAQPGRVE